MAMRLTLLDLPTVGGGLPGVPRAPSRSLFPLGGGVPSPSLIPTGPLAPARPVDVLGPALAQGRAAVQAARDQQAAAAALGEAIQSAVTTVARAGVEYYLRSQDLSNQTRAFGIAASAIEAAHQVFHEAETEPVATYYPTLQAGLARVQQQALSQTENTAQALLVQRIVQPEILRLQREGLERSAQKRVDEATALVYRGVEAERNRVAYGDTEEAASALTRVQAGIRTLTPLVGPTKTLELEARTIRDLVKSRVERQVLETPEDFVVRGYREYLPGGLIAETFPGVLPPEVITQAREEAARAAQQRQDRERIERERLNKLIEEDEKRLLHLQAQQWIDRLIDPTTAPAATPEVRRFLLDYGHLLDRGYYSTLLDLVKKGVQEGAASDPATLEKLTIEVLYAPAFVSENDIMRSPGLTLKDRLDLRQTWRKALAEVPPYQLRPAYKMGFQYIQAAFGGMPGVLLSGLLKPVERAIYAETILRYATELARLPLDQVDQAAIPLAKRLAQEATDQLSRSMVAPETSSAPLGAIQQALKNFAEQQPGRTPQPAPVAPLTTSPAYEDAREQLQTLSPETRKAFLDLVAPRLTPEEVNRLRQEFHLQ